MQSPTQHLIKRFLLVLSAVFVVLFGFTYSKSEELVLSLSVLPSDDAVLQLYFDTDDGLRLISSRVEGGEEKVVKFRMPGDTKSIRLDPAVRPLDLVVNSLVLHRVSATPGNQLPHKCLLAQNHVKLITEEEHVLRIESIGNDPQLLIRENCIPQSEFSWNELAYYLTSLVLVSMVAALAFNAAWPSRRTIVPALISITAGSLIILALLLVLLSTVNLHPDEHSHIAASAFFQNHWFKLAVDHPSTLQTLIPGWGSSYLFLNDIVYSVAEKTSAFLVPFEVPDYLRYRLFNFVLLPILLFLFIADRRNGAWFLLAFVLSTQTWYLFSYFNGDALGMFFSFLLAYHFVSNRSRIEGFFWERSEFSSSIAGLYALCVMVLFTRLHYTIFVFFIIGLIPVLRLPQGDFKSVANVSVRTALFLLLVTLPVGLVELKDQWVNDFAKAEAIGVVQEDHKRPEFKFEHIEETGKNPHLLHLRRLGHPYSDLFKKHPWVEWSYQSFFGVYGFMNIKAPESFYLLSSILGMGLTFAFLLYSAVRARWRFRIVFIYLVVFVSLVIVQSTMYSWLNGFQAQGRYLLAIVPMIAVVLALNPIRKKVPKLYLQSYLLAIFLLNIVGFAAFGVIPMISGAPG